MFKKTPQIMYFIVRLVQPRLGPLSPEVDGNHCRMQTAGQYILMPSAQIIK